MGHLLSLSERPSNGQRWRTQGHQSGCHLSFPGAHCPPGWCKSTLDSVYISITLDMISSRPSDLHHFLSYFSLTCFRPSFLPLLCFYASCSFFTSFRSPPSPVLQTWAQLFVSCLQKIAQQCPEKVSELFQRSCAVTMNLTVNASRPLTGMKTMTSSPFWAKMAQRTWMWNTTTIQVRRCAVSVAGC